LEFGFFVATKAAKIFRVVAALPQKEKTPYYLIYFSYFQDLLYLCIFLGKYII